MFGESSAAATASATGTRANMDDSLEKDGTKRATPWRMLEHPWMEEIKKKKVKMAKFLREVWDWKD